MVDINLLARSFYSSGKTLGAANHIKNVSHTYRQNVCHNIIVEKIMNLRQ